MLDLRATIWPPQLVGVTQWEKKDPFPSWEEVVWTFIDITCYQSCLHQSATVHIFLKCQTCFWCCFGISVHFSNNLLCWCSHREILIYELFGFMCWKAYLVWNNAENNAIMSGALKLFIFLSVLLIVFDCHVSLSCRLCHTRKHRPTRPDIWFKRSPFCHLLRPWLTFMLYFFVLPLIPAAISAICLLPPADRSIRKQSFKNNIISGTSLVGNQLTFTSSLSLQAQDLSVIEEVIRMMLEIINSCLCNSLHHNPNLVYALLYKRELFEQFRTHPSFQDIMQNLDTVSLFEGCCLVFLN